MKKYLWIFVIIIFCTSFMVFSVVSKHVAIKGIKISPFLITDGTRLIDNGQPYRTIGFNMYSIASLPGHNAGCGGGVNSLDAFFSTLRPNSLIRFWAWQGSMAINPSTKQLDWAGIDRVLAAAKKYNQRVIISLGTQSGQCDDGKWKDSAWYAGGYKTVNNAGGLTPMSYWTYVQQIVTRYKNSQVIGMWELINEPETSDCVGYSGTACYGHQTCVDHAKSAVILRKFFDTVGGEIKTLDTNHLIESGLIGGGQCGSDNDYYAYVHQSPGIDVASYHDYSDTSSLPGDPWNGLAVRLKQMKSVNKPLIMGEVGILAVQTGISCITLDQRASLLKAKMDTMFPAGVAAFLVWSRSPNLDANCNYDIGNTDPFTKIANSYPL